MFVKLEPVADVPPVDDSAATSSNRGDPRLGTLAGNYRLVEHLGAGGMGSIYRAEHKDLSGAVVAVKLLDRRLASTPGAGRRFLREAQAMFEIVGRNRHIPRVLDYGQTAEGESYMVMEYLRGQDLAQILKREGPMAWARAAALVLQLCDALAAAHARGILHRDIKPSNVFLIEEDGVELVKLIDFGIAKDLRAVDDQTSEGMVVGTPAFLAPELLIDGARPSVASDIYSLGATLYRLLTNKPHVTGQNWEDIAYRLQFVPLVPPSTHVGGALSPEVDELVLRALERDPEKRYTSALAFADAIRGCLRDNWPESAGPPHHPSRAGPDPRVLRSSAGRRAILFGVAPLIVVGVLALSDGPSAPARDQAPVLAGPRPADPVRLEAAARLPDPPTMSVVIQTTPPFAGAGPGTPTDVSDRLVQLENTVQALTRQLGEDQRPARLGSSLPPASELVKRAPTARQRAITSDLSAAGNNVGVCLARHGDNLEMALPVRVQVSAAGDAVRVTLPKGSRPALIACVTQVIRARRYVPGPGTETVRHVFRLRD